MGSEFNKLSVLMPVYNEARTLRTIVRRVLASPVQLEIELICVDDASTDGSLGILRELAEAEPRLKVVGHPRNRGKGAAIRTALEHATGDICLVQDADLEYDPAEYPRLVGPILEGRADAVFGSRFAASPERRVLLYWHSLGNKALTWMTNVLNDINLTDMETCYKAVRADIFKRLRLTTERFGIEPEITTRLAQWGARIYEVSISYHGRSYAEGKKIGWRDGVQAFWLLLKFRYLDTAFTDHEGFVTLRSLRLARRFNTWVFAQFADHVGRRVFEAGCGIGSFTELLLDRDLVVCGDNEPLYTGSIRHRFGHLENIEVLDLDLTDGPAYDAVAAAGPDTIICLNVLEHISDPEKVLGYFHDTLEPGGRAVVLVPANPRLYSAMDAQLGHVKRYERTELVGELTSAGFEVLQVTDFNRLGVLGWRVNRAFGRTQVSAWQMRLYSLLLPVAKLVEALRPWGGLSLIAVARKPGGTAAPAS